MAKIIVYEDSGFDAAHRYGNLVPKHQVKIRLGLPAAMLQDHIACAQEVFGETGVSDVREDPIEGEADIYFVDGLDGGWRKYATKLPRDITFLNSDHETIREEARAAGMNVLDCSLDEAIDRIEKGS